MDAMTDLLVLMLFLSGLYTVLGLLALVLEHMQVLRARRRLHRRLRPRAHCRQSAASRRNALPPAAASPALSSLVLRRVGA